MSIKCFTDIYRQLFFIMSRPKKEIIWPKLKNSGGDINADWYVEFSLRNPDTGRMERKRIYDGFRDLSTHEEKMNHGNKILAEYTEMIRKGQISAQKMIEYEDELLFDTKIYKSKKRFSKENVFRILASEFVLYKKSEISGRTMQTYKSKLRAFNDFLRKNNLNEKQILSIDNRVVVDFLKELAEEENLSRLSIEKYQQILYTFFKWVIREKKLKMDNPVLHIPRMGKVVDESAPALSKDIRNILKKKIEKADPQLWLGCTIQYYTAIRPGTEMRLIQLKNINMDARTITVKNYLAKNSRTETVDIPEQLYKIISDWNIENYDSDFYLFGSGGVPGEKPIGKNSLRLRFNKIRDELGLSKDIKFYSWKHSGALELKTAGANMYEIQRHFRHKSVTTTEGYWRKRLGGSGNQIKQSFPDIS